MSDQAYRPRYVYDVIDLIDTVDGDTWDLTLRSVPPSPGFHVVTPFVYSARFRLFDVDIVEANRAGGAAATAFGEAWIRASINVGVLKGESFRSDRYLPDGAFGRWLIDLWRVDTGVHLRDALVDAGFRKVRP